LLDCIGEAFDPVILAYIGDGFCDIGAWGVYLACPLYMCDGGDCEGNDLVECEYVPCVDDLSTSDKLEHSCESYYHYESVLGNE
jgi:hypothetical protein